MIGSMTRFDFLLTNLSDVLAVQTTATCRKSDIIEIFFYLNEFVKHLSSYYAKQTFVKSKCNVTGVQWDNSAKKGAVNVFFVD